VQGDQPSVLNWVSAAARRPFLFVPWLAQQIRQLRNVGRDPPRWTFVGFNRRIARMLSQKLNGTRTVCAIDLVRHGRGNRVMLVQIEENSATLTPFGSLIRISPVKVSRGRSWTARLRAMLSFLFR
jgi:hypothetical protein